MKIDLKELAGKFQERFSNIKPYIGVSDTLSYYSSLSGHTDEGYINVTFIETLDGVQKIELAHTTDNHERIIAILKELNPECTIHYTKAVTSYIYLIA